MIVRSVSWRRSIACGAAMMLAAPALAQPATPDETAPVPVRVDHHMHVHSPAILAFMPAYCSSEARIGPCPEPFTHPYTADEMIAQMDAAGVERGLIMSTGYLAESPMMQPPAPDHAEILRAANDFTVELAAQYPDRLAAFVGINPVTETALGEIARWSGDPMVTGIKLHLTNSDVDLRNPRHVAQLAAVFRAAHEAGLVIMVHMRTRADDYGAKDVRTFLDHVLPEAGDTPVQVAHAAGWGGTGLNTLSALDAFADALDADPAIGVNLYFDLAAVWDDDTPEDDRAALVRLIRRIGLSHFVAASDWPFSHDLVDYYGRLYPKLGLTPREWDVIRANVPPYARAPKTTGK